MSEWTPSKAPVLKPSILFGSDFDPFLKNLTCINLKISPIIVSKHTMLWRNIQDLMHSVEFLTVFFLRLQGDEWVSSLELLNASEQKKWNHLRAKEKWNKKKLTQDNQFAGGKRYVCHFSLSKRAGRQWNMRYTHTGPQFARPPSHNRLRFNVRHVL